MSEATADSRRRTESVSTRIVFDADASDCEHCGTTIEARQRHKVVTVRGADGVEQHSFCDEDCLEQWRSAAAVVN